MGILFDGHYIYPEDGSEVQEWECDTCGERFDTDHYYDITAHIEKHDQAD